MEKQIDINSDENSDWIKFIRGGEYTKEEIGIHEKLAKENEDKNSKRFVAKSHSNGYGVWDEKLNQWWGPLAHAVFTKEYDTAEERADYMNVIDNDRDNPRPRSPNTQA